MHLFPILLPLTVVAASILIAGLNRLGHQAQLIDTDHDQYRFGEGMRYFLYVGTAVVFFSPLAVFLYGNRVPLFAWIFFMGFAILFLGPCDIYASRYLVHLMNDRFIYGWLRRYTCYYCNVTSMHLIISNQGNRYLIVKTKDGHRIKFDGNLQRFDEFVEDIRVRISSANPSVEQL